MEMNSRSVFNEIIDTIETTPLTIWSATTTLIHNSHPHQQTPQTLNPLIIVLVVIRCHLLILRLHLLHQPLQIRVLLLVRHTRLYLTLTNAPVLPLSSPGSEAQKGSGIAPLSCVFP